MNVGAIGGYTPISYAKPYEAISPVSTESATEQSSKTNSVEPKSECQTCENRKYQDGSNEHNVSFKSASKVAPETAASAVRSHEQMHVKNAYSKAEKDNGKVISATVTLHTSICPECGKTYVAGGTTRTQIKYTNEENPYQKNLKNLEGGFLRGVNINMKA